MKILWLVPCLALSLAAADISGKWSGTVEVEDPGGGSTINAEVTAEFQQHATEISGKIGRTEDNETEEIKNGKLTDGKRLTFEVNTPQMSGPVKFVLNVDGQQMQGTMRGEMEDGPITGKVHLTKAP